VGVGDREIGAVGTLGGGGGAREVFRLGMMLGGGMLVCEDAAVEVVSFRRTSLYGILAVVGVKCTHGLASAGGAAGTGRVGGLRASTGGRLAGAAVDLLIGAGGGAGGGGRRRVSGASWDPAEGVFMQGPRDKSGGSSVILGGALNLAVAGRSEVRASTGGSTMGGSLNVGAGEVELPGWPMRPQRSTVSVC
jgi:hypothetical protein